MKSASFNQMLSCVESYKLTMSFSVAIKPLIKLCYILGMAPYSRIASTSQWTKNRLHKSVTFGYLIINIGIFSIYFICNSVFIDFDDPSLIVAICIYSFVVVCVQTFIVLCEAIYKRNQHIKLLNIFEKIESILSQNARIQLDNLRLKRILRRAILFWMTETLGLLAINIAIWFKSRESDQLFFFSMYAVPQAISKLSFIFWAILVVILQEHIKALATYVNLFVQTEAKTRENDAMSVKFFHGSVRGVIASRNIHILIEYVKKCIILLWEASILINDIVFWSFPVGFLNELSVLVFNCFFTIKLLLLPEIPFLRLMHISVWGTVNLINLTFVATMCEKTIEAVIFAIIFISNRKLSNGN